MHIRNTFVGGGFVLLLTALYLLCGAEFVLLITSALLFHEAGHLLAITLLGGEIQELRLDCTGGVIRYDGRNMSYLDELVAALAGPAFSLLLAFVAAWVGEKHGEYWFTLSGVSLVFCVFNMLPAARLDGGRVLYMVAARLSGIETAERICVISSCAVSLALALSGVWLLLKTGSNFTLLLCGAWLFCDSAIVKRRVWV